MSSQLRIAGPVSIQPRRTLAYPSWTILIMGPTGSGKSTFIETLAGTGHSLGISKDQLSGFTQDIALYHLQNALVDGGFSGYPTFLIDTPGFSDSKISEMDIINKVTTWMVDQGIDSVDSVIYLCPITDTRVSGSKRQVIKMLQSLLAHDSAASVTIATTMWDRLCNARAQERAEANFAQLRNDIWKELIADGAQMAKFQNDPASSLSIVRSTIQASHVKYPLTSRSITNSHPSAPFLYQQLLDRIQNFEQENQALIVDQIQLITAPDAHLESVVYPRLQEVRRDLAKFLDELVAFGRPPQGFEGVLQHVVYQNLIDRVSEAKMIKQALQLAIDMRPSRERGVVLHAQLVNAEKSLAKHSRRLVAYRNPPVGFSKKVIEDVLAPPERLIPPTDPFPTGSPTASTTSSSPAPDAPAPPALHSPVTGPQASAASSRTDPQASAASPHTSPPQTVSHARFESAADQVEVSVPVGGPGTSGLSRLKQGFKSLEEKVTTRFKRGLYH